MTQKTIGIVVASLGILCAVLSLVVVVVQSPKEGSILFLFFLAVCGGVYIKVIRPILQSRALQKTGISAKAVILEAKDTGTTVNRNPKVELLLEVHPQEGSPYKVKTSPIVSRLQASLLQPGTSVEIMHDPSDRTKVALRSVTTGPETANVGSSPAVRMDQLEELRAKGMITEEEYRQKRKEILRDL